MRGHQISYRDITNPESVRSAIREFDERGRENFLRRYGFQPSRRYFLVADDKRYDSKAILGAAHGYEFPEQGPLTHGAFRGGDQTVRRQLESLGFRVEESPSGLSSPVTRRRVWVEKLHVKGQAHRARGELALGRALWSPTASRSGGDVYRFMREVRPDDIVLHLTDGEGFTGISRAATSFEEFDGVPDTEWAGRRAYRVRLHDFRTLDPPLLRETFFGEGFGDRLVALMDDHKNLFYERGPRLHQGAYLTPLPSAVLEILEDAYRTISDDPFVPHPYPNHELVAPTAQAISDWLASAQGLTFSPASVAEFLTALQTKGFVILGGVSGTGKTKLAQAIGSLITEERGDLCVFVPVRPDWRDSRGLVGYLNPLSDTYESTPLLRLLVRACAPAAHSENDVPVPTPPYFVTLDEMNLARPEYYFAEFLSVLESGREGTSGFTRESVALHDRNGKPVRDTNESAIPDQLRLGPNLYFVGTINVDETTHGLSPKVLDRAFTLEIDDIDFHRRRPSGGPFPDGSALRSAFTRDGRFARIDQEVTQAFVKTHPDWTNWLQTLSDLLRRHDLHFAYRTFDEIAMFTMNAGAAPWFDGFGNSERSAFDVACLTKILPRFSGVRARLREPLLITLAWAINPTRPDVDAIEQALSTPGGQAPQAELPRVASKAERMLRRLEATGFASYA